MFTTSLLAEISPVVSWVDETHHTLEFWGVVDVFRISFVVTYLKPFFSTVAWLEIIFVGHLSLCSLKMLFYSTLALHSVPEESKPAEFCYLYKVL